MLNKNFRIENRCGTYYVNIDAPIREEKLVHSIDDIVCNTTPGVITVYVKTVSFNEDTKAITIGTSTGAVIIDPASGKLVVNNSSSLCYSERQECNEHIDELLKDGVYELAKRTVYTDVNQFKNSVYNELCDNLSLLMKNEVDRERRYQRGNKTYELALRQVSRYSTKCVKRKLPSISDYITPADEWWMSLDESSKESIFNQHRK